jgi:hypothetical protein
LHQPKDIQKTGVAGAGTLDSFASLGFMRKFAFLQVFYHYVSLHVAQRVKLPAACVAPVFCFLWQHYLLAGLTQKGIAS